MPKTVTPKQLAANRRNARRSTGPKTPAGRAVSKLNALKHGILSREVLVRGQNYQESQREFTALHQRFRDSLQPVGPVEEMLVDQIVTAHWRLRRALMAEAGEIALSVDEGQRKRSRPLEPSLLRLQWEGMGGDPVPRMEESTLGIGVLQLLLREVRASVEREGELTEAGLAGLARGGGKPNSLLRELEKFRLKLQENPEGLDPAALRARNREQALSLLDGKLNLLTWQKAACAEREEKEEAVRQAAAVLPPLDRLERILRYETKLERQQQRAMVQLERLQRMRQGETVPAPLSVEVSGRERE